MRLIQSSELTGRPSRTGELLLHSLVRQIVCSSPSRNRPPTSWRLSRSSPRCSANLGERLRGCLRRNEDGPATSLMTSFLMFEGEGPNDFCWASISEAPIEITENFSRPYMVDVTTCGDWKFGGAVAYAFCKHEGCCVFNDSGVLNGSPRFDADSPRDAVLANPP